jgi:LuxR family maltose regulon positive regulatory protein
MAGLALAYQELNQPENAAGIISDMQEFAWETKNPAYVTIARSCQARLALLQGDVIKARRHLQSADLTADAGIMFFWLETPRLTQCRLLIAAGTPTSLAEADQKLEVFRQAEKNNHNSLKMIEILLLQTLSYHKQARIEEALSNLGAAVLLAYISGISRPFIEAGPELLELLPQLAPQDATAPFIKTVRKEISIHHPRSALPVDGDEAAVSFAEDLTNREREVLALLADEMSNQEIAAELTISTNTVKRHTGALYRKLDVKNRRQAVTKARHFGLLPTN